MLTTALTEAQRDRFARDGVVDVERARMTTSPCVSVVT